jgi:hypothetical protein
MKKIQTVLFIILTSIIFSSLIGCASGIQSATRLENEPLPVQKPPVLVQNTNETVSKTDIIEAVREGVAQGLVANNQNSTPPPTSLFAGTASDSTLSTTNTEFSALKKQVYRNTARLNNIDKTLQLHADAIVEGTPPGMGLDPSKRYKKYKISYFKDGCALLKEGVNCDPSLKDQVDNAMREIKEKGYALVGFFGFSSENWSKDGMRLEYLTKKNQEISQARADSVRNRASDLHPDLVGDIKGKGLGSTWFWSSVKAKNQIVVIVAENPVTP